MNNPLHIPKLIILTCFSCFLCSCGSYTSELPIGDSSYLSSDRYLHLGRTHVEQKHPDFKLKPVDSSNSIFSSEKPYVRRNWLGGISDETVGLDFYCGSAHQLFNTQLPLLSVRADAKDSNLGGNRAITPGSASFSYGPPYMISVKLSKDGKSISSERSPSFFYKRRMLDSNPISKRP